MLDGWSTLGIMTIHAFDREGESDIVIEDGVTIQRHSPRPTPYGGTLRTALGLRSFHRTARREMANAGYDVVLCHVDTAPIARWLKERTSIRVVLDVHDLWHMDSDAIPPVSGTTLHFSSVGGLEHPSDERF